MASSNDDMQRFWSEQAGPKWVRYQPLLDAELAPYGASLLAALAPAAGERVLDVGCGCGATALAVAAAVGAGGAVVGVDPSTPMLELASARARAADAAHATFVLGDAQTHPFEAGAFDAFVSRFGVMFFADPPAAFRNLRAALAPEGRFAFVAWAPLAENLWASALWDAVRSVVPLPLPEPHAPGPFGLADRERLVALLADAGFHDVRVEGHSQPMSFAGGAALEEAFEFALTIGPVASALAKEPGAHEPIGAAVRATLERYLTPSGVVMPSKYWLVTGRR